MSRLRTMNVEKRTLKPKKLKRLKNSKTYKTQN